MPEETERTEETQTEETEPTPQEKPSEVEALERQLREERDARIRLESEVRSLSERKSSDQPQEKVWTRAELNAAVEAETITPEQRDDIIAEQREKSLEQRMERRFQERLAAERKQATADAERAAFHRSHPNAWVNGTPERAKLQAAFDKLVQLGHDAGDPITEVTALNLAFPEGTGKIRERTKRETHEETGGSKASGGDEKGKAWAHDIPARLQKHYDRLIEQGIYQGRDDPALVAELKIARQRQATA